MNVIHVSTTSFYVQNEAKLFATAQFFNFFFSTHINKHERFCFIFFS
jgi:hypothetical protein